uniref:cystathionine gamma-lyase n=1 Tax=Paramoeba aestuarina TaxID=180227 RepID=A0A7S4K1N9_9EUKA|mmetsp:Transcript_14609/g.22811  ORF Transcript_14609/g.22811 Transcript_14609/m.22811 type:complete len:288 (+) Transcript_14609:89-952(+)
MDNNQLHPDSLLVSSGRPHGHGAPLNHPPIFASNFVIGNGEELEYARDGSNQSWSGFETLVSDLEGGGMSTSFSSGMAAISSVFQNVPNNGNVALPTDCYGGVVALVNEGKENQQWNVKRIEAGDTKTWIEVIEKGYDLVWLEGVTNPMVEVSDIETICKTSRPANTLVCVDCTFSTPLNLQPLKKGADVSVHSATKFFGGHSDLLLGVVTTKNEELHKKVQRHRQIHGALPGAMETFLAIRGSRTLALRLERAQQNALILAERLNNHPAVMVTRYPGLPSHPQQVR